MMRRETLIDKIIALLDSGEITILIVPLYPGYESWYFPDEKISLIRQHMGPTKSVGALVHSCLHELNPGAPHDWIKDQEEKVVQALTEQERQKLLSFLKKARR